MKKTYKMSNDSVSKGVSKRRNQRSGIPKASRSMKELETVLLRKQTLLIKSLISVLAQRYLKTEFMGSLTLQWLLSK